jgi:hypothetical protein
MKSIAFAAALLLAVPAAAQPQSGPVIEDVKINQLIVYGDDPCPPSTDDQINVCARKPEGDRYRIPENLRRDPNDPANRTWTDRAIDLSYVGRTGTQSCTPVGAGGFTGCFNQLANAWRAEQQGRDSVNWNRLIEEARQARLGRIDAEAEEEERRAQGVE